MLRTIATTVALGLAVCACASGPQRPAIDPKLDSGVTSSNGGGQRATGNTPNVSVGGTGPAQTQAPSSRGPAY